MLEYGFVPVDAYLSDFSSIPVALPVDLRPLLVNGDRLNGERLEVSVIIHPVGDPQVSAWIWPLPTFWEAVSAAVNAALHYFTRLSSKSTG